MNLFFAITVILRFCLKIFSSNKIGILVVFQLTILNIPSFCQQSSSNIGFESGTFSGWSGATGQCCPVYTPFTGIDTARHVITSGNFFDPFSQGNIPVVSPGSAYSARLGNSTGLAQSERLTYSFSPASDSLLLIIKFAVILENASHPEPKQPRFGYTITSTGVVPQGCLSEQIMAGDSTYNFLSNGIIEILEWQTRVVDLTGQANETLTLTFETGDCEPGGHFGYAYVDAAIVDRKIDINACNPDGSITMIAPAGLNHTWFDGSNGDTVEISNPDPDISYTLVIESGPYCDIVLTPSVAAYIPDVQFSYLPDCYQNVSFTNSSNTNSSITFNWEFGDGTTGNTLNPIHNFASTGNYNITLHALDTSNCKSSISQTIPVYAPPKIDFENEQACIFQPCKFTGIISAATLPPYNFEWYIDGIFTENTMWMEYSFDISGIHAVQLVLEDGNGCFDTLTRQVDVADYSECEIGIQDHFIPNAFTPNGDGINDNFEIFISGNSSTFKMEIFNRFGELVYSGLRWNGTGKNQKCPDGIYTYRIHIKSNKQQVTKTGIVNLIR